MKAGPIDLSLSDLELLQQTLNRLNIITRNQFLEKLTSLMKDIAELTRMVTQKEIIPFIAYQVLCQKLGEIIKRAFPEFTTHQAPATGDKKSCGAHLFLLCSLFAYNYCVLLTRSTDKGLSDSTVFAKFSTELDNCFRFYETGEAFYNEELEKSPQLMQLRNNFFHQWLCFRNEAEYYNLNVEKLLFHLKRKNDFNAKMNSHFNGQLIYNPKSVYVYQLDQECLNSFIQACKEIHQGLKKRTQFIVFVHGQTGHPVTVDVRLNPQSKKLEIICLESARLSKQWEFLKSIIARLTKEAIAFDIIACQTNLQKDGGNCTPFAFVFANLLSKMSFEALKKHPPIPQPTFLTFELKFRDLEQLPITWIPITAFGEKAILLNQSFQEMQQQLRMLQIEKNEQEIVEKIQNWILWYNMDPRSQRSYINERRLSLQNKYDGLHEEVELSTLVAKVKALNPEQALRRYAAGFGRRQDMSQLLTKMKELSHSLEEGDSKGVTAGHQSIIKKKAKRACLLLDFEAKFQKVDAAGVTAQDLYLTSADPQLKENPFLRAKLEVSKP